MPVGTTVSHPSQSLKMMNAASPVSDLNEVYFTKFGMTVPPRQAINAHVVRGTTEHRTMITCYLRYEVPLGKLAEFEAYGRMWIELVPRFGGIHHGYFLPSEGASDIALAMFSFPSLAAYEQYRKDSTKDPDVQKAIDFAKQTRCFIRYERSFFRPVFPKEPGAATA